MGDLINDVLNADEHSESEDSDGFYGEMNDHENFNDLDFDIISSTDGAELQREHEERSQDNSNKLGSDPATNQFIVEHFEST